MIICDDPAFLFIHVPKAAGTSIAGVFAPVDLMRAAKARKEPGVRRQWIEAKGFPEEVLDLPIHVTAAVVREALGDDRFESLFRFAVVRNPWDMELSWYTYNAQTETAPHFTRVIGYSDFNDYVRCHLADHGQLLGPSPQTLYVFDDVGNQLVDRVLRYETLNDEFTAVVEHLGLTNDELDHFNRSYHAPWQEVYAPDTFALVRDRVRPDCEAFGYADEASAYGIQ